MDVITSKSSRIFHDVSRLTLKKYRDREGKYLAEGPNVIREALAENSDAVEGLFAREGSEYESFTDDTVVLSGKLFDRLSDQVASQGIIAVIRKPEEVPAGEALRKAEGNIIVLDRLQDPGNIGTILRTAEGAGIAAAVFIKGTCDPYSPKVVRSCAGSVIRLPLIFSESAGDFIRDAEEAGYTIAATDVDRGVPYYDAGLSGNKGNIALVIGNEGRGVSQELKDAADISVNIPMKGKLESLNAGIAAALLMYEMSRPE